MKHSDCVGCGLPVLELEGQFERVDAAFWHTACLIQSPLGRDVYAARLHDLVDTRKYAVEHELESWTVVVHARGDKLALGKTGELLSLSNLGSKKKSRKADGGRVFPKIDEGYNLDLKDGGVIDTVRAGFASEGAFPLLSLFELLGLAEHVHHPAALERAMISAIRETTSRHFITMKIEYGVFVPDELL
jgi:hypothetical protein